MSLSKDAYYGDPNHRPPRPSFNGAGIPASLRQRSRWVGWKFSWKDKDSKWTKLPLNPHAKCRSLAKTNDPKTWSDLRTAIEAMGTAYFKDASSVDGMGFVFADGDGIFGLDIDGCRDPDTGSLSELAMRLIRQFGTYCEISPSGMGVKLIGFGSFDGKGRKVKLPDGQELELYNRGRYFTLTGLIVDESMKDVVECSAALKEFRDEFKLAVVLEKEKATGMRDSDTGEFLTDDQIIDRLTRTAKNAATGRRLWEGDISSQGGDDSAADLALVNLIAFYTQDADRIDTIFRRSGLYRDKWERGDYRAATIAKAMEGKTVFYDPSRNGKPPATTAIGKPGKFNLTDMGNAERLIARHGENLRRVATRKTWYVWDGMRWAEDRREDVVDLMRETVRAIPEEVKGESDQARRQVVLRFAATSESAGSVVDAIRLAQSDRAVARLLDDFDTDPMILNCLNGTLDLATGKLREHSRADMITGICPTVFDPAAMCPQWERALTLIFSTDASDPDAPGNERMIGYLQRLLGLCLTGVVEAILPIFWGSGANGKSLILNTIRAVLGDSYAIQAPPHFLMAKHNESHPTELTDLQKRRLVIATESQKGRRIDEALVKWLTGGERIRAHRMRENNIEFDPTHKLILCTNHRPRIVESDEGIWRRIALIPFLTRFWNPDKTDLGKPHLKQDKRLSKALLKESPGILAWMVRGCLEWQKNGLGTPSEVEKETTSYRDEEDVIGTYLSERVDVTNSETGALFKDVFADYRQWTDESGISAWSKKAFSLELRERGCQLEEGKGNKLICKGFRLKPSEKPTNIDDYMG